MPEETGGPCGRRTVASTELEWRTRDSEFTLYFRGSKPLLKVAPDVTYPNMWRINHRGRISDAGNLARAKDAALSWALGELNRGQDGHPGAP